MVKISFDYCYILYIWFVLLAAIVISLESDTGGLQKVLEPVASEQQEAEKLVVPEQSQPESQDSSNAQVCDVCTVQH